MNKVEAHDKPLAIKGLISYRYKGRYGWVMIGAKNDADALNSPRIPQILLTSPSTKGRTRAGILASAALLLCDTSQKNVPKKR